MQIDGTAKRSAARLLLVVACAPAYLGVPGGSLAAAHVLATITAFLFALTFTRRMERMVPHFIWFVFWGASVLFVRSDRDYERFRAEHFERRYHEVLKAPKPGT